MPRRDDEYEHPGDRQDGYDDVVGQPRRRNLRESVRTRVMIPGIILIVIGFVSLIFSAFTLYQITSDPEGTLKPGYDMMEKFYKDQPQALPPFEEFVKQYTPFYIAMYGAMVVGSLLILVGGIQMARLRGYGLALTGSITASLGLCTGGCLCVSLPFGIWAVIVLMNGNVKAAFREPAGTDAS
jgi:hypothetical protein